MINLSSTVNMYITDKYGGKHWNTVCGLGFHSGEMHNLERHLAAIKSRHPAYARCHVDAETARIEHNIPQEEPIDLEALLAWAEGEV